MSKYEGKRYIVTGAASGIGEATASRLVAGGAEVITLDRNQPKVNVARHIQVDLADVASIDAAIEHLEGKFDALLNVAGVPGTLPAETVFAVNALAPRYLAEALLDQLTGGSIVIVGSQAGLGWPQRLEAIKELLETETYADGLEWFKNNPQEGNAYNFSKEVVTVYTHMMGLGLAGMGVRLNAVLPGPVTTPILADFEDTMGKESIDGVKDLVGRHATPEDIAKVVLFLASDDAGWVIGQALGADGGIAGALATGLFPTPDF